MVRVRQTHAPGRHVVIGQRYEFEGDITHLPYEEAVEAVEEYDAIEFVVDFPDSYDELQAYAKAAETDEIDGNSSAAAIAEWIDEYEELREAAEAAPDDAVDGDSPKAEIEAWLDPRIPGP